MHAIGLDSNRLTMTDNTSYDISRREITDDDYNSQWKGQVIDLSDAPLCVLSHVLALHKDDLKKDFIFDAIPQEFRSDLQKSVARWGKINDASFAELHVGKKMPRLTLGSNPGDFQLDIDGLTAICPPTAASRQPAAAVEKSLSGDNSPTVASEKSSADGGAALNDSALLIDALNKDNEATSLPNILHLMHKSLQSLSTQFDLTQKDLTQTKQQLTHTQSQLNSLQSTVPSPIASNSDAFSLTRVAPFCDVCKAHSHKTEHCFYNIPCDNKSHKIIDKPLINLDDPQPISRIAAAKWFVDSYEQGNQTHEALHSEYLKKFGLTYFLDYLKQKSSLSPEEMKPATFSDVAAIAAHKRPTIAFDHYQKSVFNRGLQTIPVFKYSQTHNDNLTFINTLIEHIQRFNMHLDPMLFEHALHTAFSNEQVWLHSIKNTIKDPNALRAGFYSQFLGQTADTTESSRTMFALWTAATPGPGQSLVNFAQQQKLTYDSSNFALPSDNQFTTVRLITKQLSDQAQLALGVNRNRTWNELIESLQVYDRTHPPCATSAPKKGQKKTHFCAKCGPESTHPTEECWILHPEKRKTRKQIPIITLANGQIIDPNTWTEEQKQILYSNATQNTQSKPPQRKHLYCDHCQRTGHVRETCFILHPCEVCGGAHKASLCRYNVKSPEYDTPEGRAHRERFPRTDIKNL